MTEPDRDLDDRTLHMVARARKGDQEAIAELYELYEQRLKGAVRNELGSRLRAKMESADLIQSVWGDVLSDMEGFEYRGADSFFHWLSFRVVRKIGDKGRYFSARKRDREVEKRLFGKTVRSAIRRPIATSDPSPSEAAMADEDLNKLMSLLGHLPDPQRQAVVLRTRDGMDFDEIARMMDRSPGAVRQLYNRALKKIDQLWNKDDRDSRGP